MKHVRKNKKRKAYTKSKSVDATCRSHGSCGWCEKNRSHKFRQGRVGSEE